MTEDIWRKLAEELKATAISGEAIENFGSSILNVQKAGMKIPFSWEALVQNPRNGHYEPVGIKWVQWLGWFAGLTLFKAWRGVEKLLHRSRHFEGVSGYEWEDAEYREFRQKRKWVEDE